MDLNDIFKQDQSDEALRTIGRMIATHYKALLDNGIPLDLAANMAEDYHWLFVCSIMFKDTAAYPPRS